MSLFKRKKKQDDQVIAVVPEPTGPKPIFCKVVGVTFDNEDGTNRQDLLQAIRKELVSEADPEDLYGGYSNKEIIEDGLDYVPETLDMDFPVTLQQYDFNGEPAVAVIYNNNVIGNLPKEYVPYFIENSQNNIYKAKCELTGCKCKVLRYDEDTDKERVKRDELTYGAEIIISFK